MRNACRLKNTGVFVWLLFPLRLFLCSAHKCIVTYELQMLPAQLWLACLRSEAWRSASHTEGFLTEVTSAEQCSGENTMSAAGTVSSQNAGPQDRESDERQGES